MDPLIHHTDEDLLCRIQKQEHLAFEELHQRYLSALQRHARGIVHEGDASADVVQEVFIRVWQKAEQWNGSGSVRAWLYKITTNLSLNHLRSQKRRPRHALPTPTEHPVSDQLADDWETRVPARLIDSATLRPEVIVLQAEEKQQVWSMVDDLPKEKGEVLRMVYESEMDLKSVADALDVPEGTVKSRIYHSKRTLATRWESSGWDDYGDRA